jgi:hypothetical protein
MEKMMNLLPQQRIEMGKNGREKAIKEFDENIIINKYLGTIFEIENQTTNRDCKCLIK